MFSHRHGNSFGDSHGPSPARAGATPINDPLQDLQHDLGKMWNWIDEVISNGIPEASGRKAGDVIGRLLTEIYTPQEIVESPQEALRFQSNFSGGYLTYDRRWLTGNESPQELSRLLAEQLKRPSLEFEEGLKGSLRGVSSELRILVDQCVDTPWMLTACFKGVLYTTIARMKAERRGDQAGQLELILSCLERVPPRRMGREMVVPLVRLGAWLLHPGTARELQESGCAKAIWNSLIAIGTPQSLQCAVFVTSELLARVLRQTDTGQSKDLELLGYALRNRLQALSRCAWLWPAISDASRQWIEIDRQSLSTALGVIAARLTTRPYFKAKGMLLNFLPDTDYRSTAAADTKWPSTASDYSQCAAMLCGLEETESGPGTAREPRDRLAKVHTLSCAALSGMIIESSPVDQTRRLLWLARALEDVVADLSSFDHMAILASMSIRLLELRSLLEFLKPNWEQCARHYDAFVRLEEFAQLAKSVEQTPAWESCRAEFRTLVKCVATLTSHIEHAGVQHQLESWMQHILPLLGGELPEREVDIKDFLKQLELCADQLLRNDFNIANDAPHDLGDRVSSRLHVIWTHLLDKHASVNPTARDQLQIELCHELLSRIRKCRTEDAVHSMVQAEIQKAQTNQSSSISPGSFAESPLVAAGIITPEEWSRVCNESQGIEFDLLEILECDDFVFE
ncbi:MAG: hypothetical protein R3C18_08420 [Planctomycetaceae bacterium]